MLTSRHIRKRLQQLRAALEHGDLETAERIETELHTEVLHWIACNGTGPVRRHAQLAIGSRQLWLE